MSLPGLTVKKPLFLFIFLLSGLLSVAQPKVISGYIKDALSDERIPFASIEFVNARSGKLSDSAGNFRFVLDRWPDDTLLVTYVGYQDNKIPLVASNLETSHRDTLNLVIRMERGKY